MKVQINHTILNNIMLSFKKKMKSILHFLVLILFVQFAAGQSEKFEIVIYGGTSSGIAAAIQSSRMGKSVVLIEPTNRIGGLTTGGLGQTDIGKKQAIGGISREFYENIKIDLGIQSI